MESVGYLLLCVHVSVCLKCLCSAIDPWLSRQLMIFLLSHFCLNGFALIVNGGFCGCCVLVLCSVCDSSCRYYG